MTWFQGWKNAPEISQRCLESWRHYNPSWDIKLLDKDNYKEHINIDEVLPNLETNYISLGDILRLFLLKDEGGVWADSTTWCNKPLDTWVHDTRDAFCFTRPDRGIASWFISAQPNSYIIDVWYNAMVEYWKHRIKNTDTFEQQYGWIHALFRQCYSQDKKFKQIVDSWDKIDCYSDGNERGHGPHLFAPYKKYFYNPISKPIANRINAKVDPVYKLSYKTGTEWRNPEKRGIHPGDEQINMNYPKNSELYYLLNTI